MSAQDQINRCGNHQREPDQLIRPQGVIPFPNRRPARICCWQRVWQSGTLAHSPLPPNFPPTTTTTTTATTTLLPPIQILPYNFCGDLLLLHSSLTLSAYVTTTTHCKYYLPSHSLLAILSVHSTTFLSNCFPFKFPSKMALSSSFYPVCYLARPHRRRHRYHHRTINNR